MDDPRVIVARTFSKIYGMAGLRLGYSVAAENTTKLLQSWQLEDNGNMIALHAGLAALADDAAMRAAVARNAADRKEFLRQAAVRKLHAIPSYANFAMVETGRPVRQVIQHFHGDNIAVGRPFPRMENFLRVSFSTPDDMAAFWQCWDKLPRDGKTVVGASVSVTAIGPRLAYREPTTENLRKIFTAPNFLPSLYTAPALPKFTPEASGRMSVKAVREFSPEVSSDDFHSLEEKIYRTIELLKSAREAKAAAERDVSAPARATGDARGGNRVPARRNDRPAQGARGGPRPGRKDAAPN